MWPVATLALGASLWAQLFGVALVSELGFATPRMYAVFAYLLPLLMLGAGVAWRVGFLLLTLMPVCILPGLALLPPGEQLLLTEAWSMLRLGVSLALYLAVASAGAQALRPPDEIEPVTTEVSLGLDLKRLVFARIAALMVLFALPTYAVFVDPTIAANMSRNYPDSPEAARVFLALLHFFSWSVAAYMMVLLPALNLEYDHRRLQREIDEAGDGLSRRSIGLRVAIVSAVALGSLGVMLALFE